MIYAGRREGRVFLLLVELLCFNNSKENNENQQEQKKHKTCILIRGTVLLL